MAGKVRESQRCIPRLKSDKVGLGAVYKHDFQKYVVEIAQIFAFFLCIELQNGLSTHTDFERRGLAKTDFPSKHRWNRGINKLCGVAGIARGLENALR